MRYGGIYRRDPQPVQGRRFAPIPAQGDQPPRRGPAMLGMVAVLSCWPTGLEHQPQQRRVQIAPIASAVVAQHIPPARRQPHVEKPWHSAQSRRGIAPLTLAYGDQPPFRATRNLNIEAWRAPHVVQQPRPRYIEPPAVQAFVPAGRSATHAIIVRSWQRIESPPVPTRKIAPLTLAYGDQPPGFCTDIVPVPPDPWPRQPLPRIAPLIQVQGDQPPPSVSLRQIVAVNRWRTEPPIIQRRPRYIPELVVVVNDPPPRSPQQRAPIAVAWIPPPPQPRQNPRTFSPAINQQVRTPGTIAGESTSGTLFDWVNPENAGASDDVYATVTFPSQLQDSERLVWTNCGFAIPSTAIIRGYQIDIECKVTVDLDGNPTFKEVMLLLDGTSIGSNKGLNTQIRGTERTSRWGGPTDTWNVNLGPEQVNRASFGFLCSVGVGLAGGSQTVSVDHGFLTIWFEDPGYFPSSRTRAVSQSVIVDSWRAASHPAQRRSLIVPQAAAGARKLIGPPFRLVGPGGLVG